MKKRSFTTKKRVQNKKVSAIKLCKSLTNRTPPIVRKINDLVSDIFDQFGSNLFGFEASFAEKSKEKMIQRTKNTKHSELKIWHDFQNGFVLVH